MENRALFRTWTPTLMVLIINNLRFFNGLYKLLAVRDSHLNVSC
jgi:hypothetical protein